jgi:hypothetical protein
VETAKCVRPSLIQGIMEIRQRYAELQHIGSVLLSFVLSYRCSARQVLNEALLELRALLLEELGAVANYFRNWNKPKDVAAL